jgi:hypothetical protein
MLTQQIMDFEQNRDVWSLLQLSFPRVVVLLARNQWVWNIYMKEGVICQHQEVIGKEGMVDRLPSNISKYHRMLITIFPTTQFPISSPSLPDYVLPFPYLVTFLTYFHLFSFLYLLT